MDVQELLSQVTDKVTVARVFGEPIERDGALVIPVARVRGGAGGGSGTGPGPDGEHESSGSGGGGGFDARPAGVYLVRGGDVEWRPAVDVTRIAIGGQVVAVALLLVLRSVLRRR
ncbi:MAG TPA: spore germination protein GerW family protein [Pedococcus sp.]|jgi:uncharacterized spore protein YtfJ